MVLNNYELDCICLKHGLDSTKIFRDKAYCNDTDICEQLHERLLVLRKNRQIVQNLLKVPRIEQKSSEWYTIRENLITASDFAQALKQGKFGSQDDIFKKKVRPQDDVFVPNPFFKWGNMFEPVANEIYSILHHGVKVHEFGLIPHPKHSFFGASPDGITETGIMLEIKCPYKRKIQVGGEVPKQYYYQIQGQLDVCGLTECDYFECQFYSYDTEQDFWKAFDDDVMKGIVLEITKDKFIYSPIVVKGNNVTVDVIHSWLDQYMTDEIELVDIKFWYLSHYNLQRVTLDKAFFDENIVQLEEVWNKVLSYREDPKKYELEVLKTFTIPDTQCLSNKTMKVDPKSNSRYKSASAPAPTISGYAFIDTDE